MLTNNSALWFEGWGGLENRTWERISPTQKQLLIFVNSFIVEIYTCECVCDSLTTPSSHYLPFYFSPYLHVVVPNFIFLLISLFEQNNNLKVGKKINKNGKAVLTFHREKEWLTPLCKIWYPHAYALKLLLSTLICINFNKNDH